MPHSSQHWIRASEASKACQVKSENRSQLKCLFWPVGLPPTATSRLQLAIFSGSRINSALLPLDWNPCVQCFERTSPQMAPPDTALLGASPHWTGTCPGSCKICAPVGGSWVPCVSHLSLWDLSWTIRRNWPMAEGLVQPQLGLSATVYTVTSLIYFLFTRTSPIESHATSQKN